MSEWHANGSDWHSPAPDVPLIADDGVFSIMIEHMFALYAMGRKPDHGALITVDAHYDGDLDVFSLKIGMGEPAAAILHAERAAREGAE